MTDGKNAGDRVVIERTFDAPTDFIWQLWTDPERFKGHCCVSAKRTRDKPPGEADRVCEPSRTTDYGQRNTPI